MSNALLTASDINITRQTTPLLRDVSLQLTQGKVTTIMGHNGAGKTILLHALHELTPLTSGHVKTIPHADQKMVFQKPILMRRVAEAHFSFASSMSDEDSISYWFDKAGLSDKRQTQARHLSSGEAQKLALIAALATKPKLLFIDEPTANLDAESTADVEALLRQAAREGMTILLVTHSLAQARRLSDHMIYLEKGTIIDDMPAADFFAGAHSDNAKAFLANL